MHASLLDLPTPALVLDADRCARNCRRMSERMATLGPLLRPHLKTAKCVQVAHLATAGGPARATVSTLSEAAWLAQRGLTDLRLAVCPSPALARGAARLAASGVALSVIADDLAAVEWLATEAAAAGVRLPVLVEVDCGEHRTGVDPSGPLLLAVARAIHEQRALQLLGVLTHGGHAYACRSRAERVAVAEQERATVVSAAERLRAHDLPCPEVSAGSTPTATHALSLQGVTEMRPGVYVFGDAFQAAIGACSLDDVALTVLATVIANRPGQGTLVLDAGALALSKDRSTAGLEQDVGYGLLLDLDGRPLHGLRVDEVHQEHGAVHGVPAAICAELPLGSRVRVLPNHACITAAGHDRYAVVEHGSPAVVAFWERCRGW